MEHEHVGAAHILLNLDVRFAVLEPRDQSLPASQSEKIAVLVAERLLESSTEDFDFVIDPGAFRLAFHFLFRGFFPVGGSFRADRHQLPSLSLSVLNSGRFSVLGFQSSTRELRTGNEELVVWLGR